MLDKKKNSSYVEKRNTVPFFRNWLLSAMLLPEQDLGMLMKCCISYVEKGVVPEEIKHTENLGIRMMFDNFRYAEDSNFEKFVAQCDRNKANRQKGINKAPEDEAAAAEMIGDDMQG